MTGLTRRRDTDTTREKWSIFFDGAYIGSIERRAGVPNHVDQWEWRCGFYPGCDPGHYTSGWAQTFELARVAFEAAWHQLLPTRTEEDLQAWRDQRDWTERKYAMWAHGEKQPSQIPSSRMVCVCGEDFDSHNPVENQIHGLISMPRSEARG
jgi:hypothetical protein